MLHDHELVQPEVLQVFQEAQQLYPDLFLAGGYLRDRQLGVMPNDVDFFTFVPVREDRQEFISHEEAFTNRTKLEEEDGYWLPPKTQ